MEAETIDNIQEAQLKKEMGPQLEVGLRAQESLFSEQEKLENIYGLKSRDQEGDVAREGMQEPEKL